MTGFKNPSSTLPPSNSFKIFVDSSANQIIDSIESGLFATPSIQAGPLTNVEIIRDSNVTGAEATFTVKFTTTNALTETNGIFLSFSPPSGFLYEGSAPTCSYNGGAVGSAGCSATFDTGTYGNEATVVRARMD